MRSTQKFFAISHTSRFLAATAIGSLLFIHTNPAWSDEGTTLRTVVVSGSAIDDRFGAMDHDPASSTLITGEQVDEQHAINIIEVLRTVPGITADLRGGADGTKIRIRGIDNQRFMGEKPGVAIIIDGVPVFERVGRVNIDLDNIESIRVIKGGASYLYGEDALAGAVVITTKRGSRHEGVTVEHDRGSYGYQRSYVKAGWLSEQVGGHLQYSERESDGYYALSDDHQKTLAGNLQWFINPRSDVTFGFEKSDRYRDREGSVTGVTNAKNDPAGELAGRGRTRHFDIDLQRLNLTYSNNFSETGNLLAIAYQFDDKTDFWVAPIRFDGDGNAVGDDQVDAYQNINNYQQQQRGIKLEARDSFGQWGLMGGLEFKKNTFDEISTAKEDYRASPSPATFVAAGTLISDSWREEITQAGYSEGKVNVGHASTLTMNYRLDRIELKDENRMDGTRRNDRLSVSSWRLGGDHRISPLTSMYGGISTGFRAPTLEELSSNPNLKPEHSINYEIGVRSDMDLFGWPAQLNSSIFHIRRKDYIMSNIGQYVNANAADDVYHDNIGDVVSQGLELALQTEVHNQLAFDLTYTYLDSYFVRYDEYYMALGNPRGTKVDSLDDLINPSSQVYFMPYDNTGNKVPRTPTHTVNFRTHWHPSHAWRFTTEIDYRGESYADEINQEKQPARTLLNMMLTYKTKANLFGSGKSSVNAFIKVENVLDDQFFLISRGHYDTNYDGVYDSEDPSIVVDPGRIWTAGISVKF